MTDRLAPPDLRVLAPRAVGFGPGDGEALENVDTTNLPDGCLAFVSDFGAFYVFRRSSTLTPPAIPGGVITPASGPGQWIVLSGFEAGAAFSYQIALDSPPGAIDTSGGNWAPFASDTKWSEADGAITNTGLIVGTGVWTSATPGAGILTYDGPTRFFLFSADVSVERGSTGDEPVWGLYITKNGSFIGTNGDLLREQQGGLVEDFAGADHIHTESRLIAQAGDTFQILMIDRSGAPQDVIVDRASFVVAG